MPKPLLNLDSEDSNAKFECEHTSIESSFNIKPMNRAKEFADDSYQEESEDQRTFAKTKSILKKLEPKPMITSLGRSISNTEKESSIQYGAKGYANQR
jgi:hypothetical protein